MNSLNFENNYYEEALDCSKKFTKIKEDDYKEKVIKYQSSKTTL